MKKYIKIIFIILLILLIVILISLRFVTKNQDNVIEGKTNQELRDEAIKEYFSDKVLPQGVSTLYGKYKGSNDKNDLYRSIAKMLNYLPQISNDLKFVADEKISEYYLANKTQIEKYLGIETVEEFSEFVEYVSAYDIDNSQYQYCSIDSSTYDEDNKYFTFNLNIVYQNDITLKVHFAKSQATKPEVKYSVID